MNLEISHDDASGTVKLSGALDLYGADQLGEALRSELGRGGDVRLDLESVGGCDVAGAQLLLAAAKTLAARGNRLHVEKTSPGFLESLQQIGLPAEVFQS
jgi:anti-anti-sigma factor